MSEDLFIPVLALQIKQLMELMDQDDYPKDMTRFMEMVIERVDVSRDRWTCFHCGFTTTDPKDAEAHFGERDDPEEFLPFCTWWAKLSEETRAQEMQDKIREINEEHDRCGRLIVENENLEYQVGSRDSEIKSHWPFRDCRSIRDIFNVYDSVEGRMLAAEERLARWEKVAFVLTDVIARRQISDGFAAEVLSELTAKAVQGIEIGILRTHADRLERLTTVEKELESLKEAKSAQEALYADSIANVAHGIGSAIEALQRAAKGIEKGISGAIWCPRCGIGVRIEEGRCEFCQDREQCESCKEWICVCDKEKILPSLQ